MSLNDYIPPLLNPADSWKIISGQYKFQNPKANLAEQKDANGQMFDRNAMQGTSRGAAELGLGAAPAKFLDKTMGDYKTNTINLQQPMQPQQPQSIGALLAALFPQGQTQ